MWSAGACSRCFRVNLGSPEPRSQLSAGSTPGQARAADGGGEPPHSMDLHERSRRMDEGAPSIGAGQSMLFPYEARRRWRFRKTPPGWRRYEYTGAR